MSRSRILLAAALAVLGTVVLAAGTIALIGRWTRTPAVRVFVTGDVLVVRTAKPAVVYLAYGTTPAYGLFTAPSRLARVHRFALTHLKPETRYDVRAVVATAGRTSHADAVVLGPARPARASLAIVGDHLELDGRPWIARFVWNSCTTDYAAEAAIGINAFMSSGCGDTPQAQDAAAARVGGVVIPWVGAADANLPTTVATFVVDEPDLTRIPPAQLAQQAGAYPGAHGLPVFETLSRYAYLRSLSPARGLYGSYASLASVLGIDIYPIFKTGDPNRLGDVAAAQRMLVALAGGKPTYQWIEAIGHGTNPANKPTPRDVVAETWMALTTGARALGYWTYGPPPFAVDARTGRALQALDATIDSLAPAIDAAPVSLGLSDPGLDAFATQLDGALYVFAVNPSPTHAVAETFTLAGLRGRELRVYRNGRTITPAGDTFRDALAPLAWRVYLVPPG